jgi:hypothetical protein
VNWYVTPNPLLARLIRCETNLSLRKEITFTAWLLGISIIYVPVSIETGALFCFGPPLALLALASVVFIPILITVHAWRITAHHLQDNSDELLRLTNLSSEAILGAYVAASLYRWRSLLCWVIGLTPAMILSLAFTLLLYQVGIDREQWCINSPLGTRYCTPTSTDRVMTPEGKLALDIQLVTAGICASIGVVGIFLLAGLTGTGLAYWLRDTMHASISAVVLFSGVAVVWAVLFIELGYSALLSPAPSATPRVVFYSLLFGSAPYPLALGCGRLGLKWVRKLA